jgi:CRP/FNR family cyclic AMP-dependent transcriptional regulator
MVEKLKLIGPLARLSDDDVAPLLECAAPRAFRTDEVILDQGQLNSSLYVVLDGLLHVRRYANGRQVLLGRLGPGSFFGDVSLFDPGPTSAAVVGVSAGRLLEISNDQLRRFTHVRPSGAAELLAGLLELMAKRLRRTDDRLIDAIFWGGLLRDEPISSTSRARGGS